MQAHTNGDTTSINTSSSSSVGSVTGTAEESHECYVFISNKLASDITLTIGQAFDLAYRRYMTDSGKQFEISKLQSHNKILESTVQTYRDRLREVAEVLSKSDLDKLLLRLGVRDICEVQVEAAAIDGNKTPDLGELQVLREFPWFIARNSLNFEYNFTDVKALERDNYFEVAYSFKRVAIENKINIILNRLFYLLGIDVSQNDDQMLIETSPKNTFAPIVPPRNQMSSTIEALKPSVGTKLEGLLLNSDSDSDFDPRADEPEMNNSSKMSNDLFGFEPSKPVGQQLFNSGSFTDGTTNNFTSNHASPPPLCE